MLIRVGVRRLIGVLGIILLCFLNSNAGELKVEWQPNTEADLAGYKVYYGISSRNYTSITDVGLTTSYVVSNLEVGHNYYFAVTAYDTAGNESAFSEEVFGSIPGSDGDAPAQPASPVCTVQQTTILVQWQANSEPDVAGYLVRYGTASGNYSEEVNVGNVTSYTTPNLQNGTTYYFVVAAYDTAGNYSSNSSETKATINVDNEPPATPAIATYRVNDQRVFIQWQANAEPDLGGYVLYYGTASRNYSEIVDVGNKTSYETPTLNLGTTYYFAVSAYDVNQNESPFSAEIAITMAVDDTIPPPVPTISTIELDQYRVKLNWQQNQAADLDGYKVYYGSESRIYDVVVDAGMALSFTSDELVEGTTYFFAVTAYDTAGNESEFSAEKSITIETVDNTPPSIYAVDIRDSVTVSLVYSEAVNKSTAENVDNYTIVPDIQIQSVELGSGGRIVTIRTSPHRAGIDYTIRVSNVTDLADIPNAILSNASSTYTYNPDDHTPPQLVAVQIIDGTHLNIQFSEELDRASAENVDNYHINNGVQVLKAVAHTSLREVLLTTTMHVNHQEHVLTVSNVKDRAPVPNIIGVNNTLSYIYHEVDKIAPAIYTVRMKDDMHVEIFYTEPVEQTSAENTANYSINNNIRINSATLNEAGQVVVLETTPHLSGFTYTLTVNHVNDLAYPPNGIAANSSYSYTYTPEDRVPPSLLLVDILDATHVDVTFNEDVDRVSAENVANYSISNSITVIEANLDVNRRVVHLVTSEHRAGKTYLLTVNGVVDLAPVPNMISSNSQLAYTFLVRDVTPPTIAGVTIVDATTVEVRFSEMVDRASAETIENYQISNGILITGVLLLDDLKTVRLKTTEHALSGTYILVVNNVKDRSFPANTIATNSSFQYVYQAGSDAAGQIVANIDRTGYVLVQISEKQSYYADRSYVVESIPQELKNAYWICTKNDDRSNSSEKFLSFDLREDATVYIGYDSRAKSVPNWLKNNFTRTNKYVGVTEYAERLVLWQKDFVKTTITLGGNMAKGASGVESMYVILIKPNNAVAPPELEDTSDPQSMGKANVFLLYQNYPNPFNAGTEIRFQLPTDCHVTLTIYNVLGQEVIKLVNGFKEASHHVIRWDGKNYWGRSVPSGVYFSRLEITRNVTMNDKTVKQTIYNDVRKMILLK